MPKMGLEALLEALEQGQVWPGTQLLRFTIPADDLKKYRLRKPKSVPDAQYYTIWMVNIGEQGSQLANFYDFNIREAVKKAYKSRFPTEEVAVNAE